jgi:predicted tellurium resistance membrane protein TerC
MVAWMSNPEIWLSLVTLAILEVVLGIDNLVILTVVSDKLPPTQRRLAQRIGLGGALGLRILFLSTAVWIAGLVEPVFELFDTEFSWRDIIFFVGGAFLLVKGSTEIHSEFEGEEEEGDRHEKKAVAGFAFFMVLVQIMAFDLIFSIDSVVAAVGMTQQLPVMVAAVVLAMLAMLFAAEPTSVFIKRHPSVKMLALSFLLLIGMSLVADAFHQHLPRGFLYFAIAFSMLVEVLNLVRTRKHAKRKKES